MGIFRYWPNRITALRFVGALVLFGILAVAPDQPGVRNEPLQQAAYWIFVAVALSDILDGWLARRGNVVSAFGRVADPFVDKVLVLGTMVFLAVATWSRPMFPAWVVVAVLAREFLVTGIRGYMESVGAEFPADGFGKIKMLAQSLSLGFALGARAFPWSDAWYEFLMTSTHVLVWIMLVATVGSGLSYVNKTRSTLGADSPPGGAA